MKRLLVVWMLTVPMVALAQKTVYRCESAGKVAYSHEPCVGAREVDTTPTQGLDKMSGHSRKGRTCKGVSRPMPWPRPSSR